MLVRNGKLGLAALSLTVLGLVALPLGAQAQGNQSGTDTSAEASGPKIKLQLENADLYTALKLLFAQAKAQFTLDPALRSIFITVNINQPFRNALETLLRASGQPLTYKLENEVYSIVPKSEDVTADITDTEVEKPAQTVNLKKYFSTRFKYNSFFLIEVLRGANLIPSIYGGQQGGGQGGFGSGGFGLRFRFQRCVFCFEGLGLRMTSLIECFLSRSESRGHFFEETLGLRKFFRIASLWTTE
jgi:hypothetical protein